MNRPGTNQDLYAIERKLLDAVDREYARYSESDQAIPQTLVKLMVEAHEVITKRLAKTHGQGDRPLDDKGLRALAIDLEQELAEVRTLLQQGGMLS